VPSTIASVCGSKPRSKICTTVGPLASVDGAAVGVGVAIGDGAVVDFGVVDADPTTSIDPRISGWKMQRNAYVPAVENVCV